MNNMPIGDYPFKPQPAQGWQCPVCQSVMSPTTPMCFKCSAQTFTTDHIDLTAPHKETLTLCPHGQPVKFKTCEPCNMMKYDPQPGWRS